MRFLQLGKEIWKLLKCLQEFFLEDSYHVLVRALIPRPGLEIGHFWKNSNSRKLKTQAKNSNSSKKPSKTQAIKLNYGQFHSNYWISLGKNISLLIKITLYAKISNIFGSKFGIYLENSSSKLNLRQIHLVYLPKPGPISKPGLTPTLCSNSRS